jgi:hypothetical protein
MDMIYIGIDPDAKKNGIATIESNKLELYNLTFFETLDFIKNIMLIGKVYVFIEAGFLNQANWHTKIGQSIATAAEIGNRTGANHETARKLHEMVEYLGCSYKLVKPTSSKIKTEFFHKITGIKKSNQEQRDAAMLIINYLKI